MYKKRIYRHTHKKPIILKNYVYMNAKINKAYCVPYRRQQFSRSERKVIVIVILTIGFIITILMLSRLQCLISSM